MDDNSPQNLLPTAAKFAKSDDQISVRYFRNELNLRPYWNGQEGWSKIAGKYFIFLPHDDFYVSDDFIAEGVRALSAQKDCAVFIGNSRLENSDETMMPSTSDELKAYDGRCFTKNMLWGKAHPAYSSVIIENSRLLEVGYSSLLFPREMKEKLDVEPDELFAGIVLASTGRKVLLTGKIFSVRGRPEGSYSVSEHWRTRGHLGVFLMSVRMIQYFLSVKELQLAAFFTSLAIGLYAPQSLSLPVIRFMGYSPIVISLMVFAVSRRLWRKRVQSRILRIWGQVVSTTGAAGPSAPQSLSLRIMRFIRYAPFVIGQMVFRVSRRHWKRVQSEILRRWRQILRRGSSS